MENKLLIFIPTYNERENIEPIYDKIRTVCPGTDILFLDDNSPDGTGDIADAIARKDSGVNVVHRSGKSGIGAAHQAGIRWAYDQGYAVLVTMDCDFTHQPEDIPRFLGAGTEADVVVGSRYMDRASLREWNLFRKLLTLLGHFLTRVMLRMPEDASGAFRLYRLDRIAPAVFDRVSSKGYSFFFESLHVLSLNGYSIREVSICLPARTYGHSKMTLKDAWASFSYLVSTWWNRQFHKERFLLPAVSPSLKNPADAESEWDGYWKEKSTAGSKIYDRIAEFYRLKIINPTLDYFMRREFVPGARLLHAGCGGGQVDTGMVRYAQVTALDISQVALQRYREVNRDTETIHGSIFQIPCENGTFDGIYNLGVMEHFTETEIQAILGEFCRVLKPGGKVVFFWPPEFGLSVIALKNAHFVLNRILKKNVKLHPDEHTRIHSGKHAERLLASAGFKLRRFYFGPRDFFTHAVVVGEKQATVAVNAQPLSAACHAPEKT